MSGGKVQKVKKSRSRVRSRRAQWFAKAKPVALGPCDRCRQPRPPHHVCPHCGWYRGREYESAITQS